MKKIKVVHIVEDLKIGGLERVISAIATGLDKNKFDVSVWCLCRGGDIYDELKARGIDVVILGMRSHRNLLFFVKFCIKLFRSNADIVHTHGVTAITLGRLAAKVAGIKVIISHIHTIPVNYTQKQFVVERYLSKISDAVICCSKAAVDYLVKKSNITADKLRVLYNGVDVERFKQEDDKELKKDAYIIGCVASLYEHKGHRFLIQAARYVVDQVEESVKFVLVGQGPLLAELKELSVVLGLEKEVVFHDVESDIAQLVHWFDMVVLPSSIREGLGLALIEGMAAGKPVVGSNLGGIPEVVDDGVNGYLVEPKDSKALADAIIKVIVDKDMAAEMGIKGRQKVEEKFSNKAMLMNVMNIYEELAKAKGILND